MAGIYEDEILGAQQQRDLARKLRDTEVPSTGHMIGDWYVAPTVAQQLSAVLKQGIGAYKENQAEDELKGLKQERARSSADAFSQMGMQAPSGLLAEAGTPAIKPSIMDRIGAALTFNAQPKGTPAQPYQQTIAQSPNETQTMGGILNLAGSNPEMAAVAQAMQGQKWTRENAAALAKQALIEKNAAREDTQSFQASQNELARIQAKTLHDDTLANRQAPSWQTHTSPNGDMVQIHPQTGEVRPLQGIKGKDTSNPPMTVAREKMIYSNEDLIDSSKAAVKNLNDALVLNPKAYEGAFSNAKALVQSNNPFANEEDKTKANDTVEYDNLVRNNAVTQLKAIFAGNPTEGERKVLLDLAASADKTAAQREAILKRGIAAAEKRLQLHTERGKGLRSGEFFVPEETDPYAGFTEAEKAEFEKEHGVAK
jgi:hypothetical protein